MQTRSLPLASDRHRLAVRLMELRRLSDVMQTQAVVEILHAHASGYLVELPLILS